MNEDALADRLRSRRIVLCAGSGGVGKTTVSAALGMALAASGRAVLVLTIDPARRLATALGMSELGTRPVTISARALAAAGIPPAARLDVAMLDARSEWDRVIERHAPSRAVHDRILANPFYRGITQAFAGSQEYAALEALHRFESEYSYEVIVVDTPPTRDTLAFLEAPDRLADFVGARVLSWLAGPSRVGWRAVNLAAAPFLRMADRLLGSEVLQDLAAFVNDLESMYAGVRERAAAVGALMRSPRTAFVVVTSLEPEPFAEAERFVAEIALHRMQLEAIVVNRVLPAMLADPAGARAAARIAADGELRARLSSALGDRGVAPALRRVAEAHLVLHALARSEAAQLDRLRSYEALPVVRLPLADRDIHDLAGLRQLAERLGMVPR